MRDNIHAHWDKRQYVHVISAYIRIWTYAADLHQYIEARDTLDLKEEARRRKNDFFFCSSLFPSLLRHDIGRSKSNITFFLPPMESMNVCENERSCLSTLRRITTSEMNSSNCRQKKSKGYSILLSFVFFSSSSLLSLSYLPLNCLFERNLSFTHLAFHSNLECHILLAERISRNSKARND